MSLISEQRIVQVVWERVAFVKERTPEYHKHLVLTLVKVVREQSHGFSTRSRRERVKRIIEELGMQMLTQQQESE